MARKKLGQISQRSGRRKNIEIIHRIRGDHGKIRQRSFREKRQKLGGYQAEIRHTVDRDTSHHDHAHVGYLNIIQGPVLQGRLRERSGRS
jgi:hypothetical protein